MSIKAVIFDLGGVVLDSPVAVLAAYEAQRGLPPHTLARIIVEAGRNGAWSRLERGELRLQEFFKAFDTEVAAAGGHISSAELMAEIARSFRMRPVMLEAIRRIRSAGLKVAALTNNWLLEDHDVTLADLLRAEFDVFVESSAVGMQKPDPRIYDLVCERLWVQPDEAVFLDDIGRNLKPARLLGMVTIRVDEPEQALSELEAVLGMQLRSECPPSKD